MMDVSILIASIVLQFLAAVLALSLIRITRKRAAWILIAIALALMTVRRVTTLARVGFQPAAAGRVDLFDVLGLSVSALMVIVFLYIRRYFFDVFTSERILHESELRYRTLAQNIPDAAVFLFDSNRRLVLAEGPLLAQGAFCRTASGTLATGQISLTEDWVGPFASLQESALDGREAEVQHSHQGRTFSIRAIPLREPSGSVAGGMAIALDITSQLKAEEDRAAAFSFLQHTVNGVAEPVMVIDPDYKVTLMNQVVRESYDGHPRAGDILCYALSHHRHAPCDGVSHPCPLKQVQESLSSVKVLHQHQTAEGDIRQVEILASPLFSDTGQFLGVIEAARDITERERAAETVRQLSQAVEQSPASVVITDVSGVIEYVNPKFSQLTGYSLEEARRHAPGILGVGPWSQEEVARVWESVQGGEVWRGEFLNRKKTGEEYWEAASISAVKDTRGTVTHFVAVKEDITQRKHAEENARRHTKELEDLTTISASMRVAESRSEIYPVLLKQVARLFRASGVAIAVRDKPTGQYVCALGCLEWADWTGHPLPAGMEVARRMMTSRRAQRIVLQEHAPLTTEPDLLERMSDASCLPLVARGETIGAIWLGMPEPMTGPEIRLLDAIGDMAANAIQRQTLFEDLQVQLEALRTAQARLVQTEKLAALGQLISGVAHELNNPLTSVVLYSELVRQEQPDAQARCNLDKVVTEAIRAGKIVKALLDFARQRPLDRKSLQVNDVVEECVDLVNYELRTHNVRLELDLDRTMPPVLADAHQLQQVLVNLLNNAWQAMSQFRGRGCLKVVTESGPPKYAPPIDDRQTVRILVSDDGPGIPATELHRVFDPFFTTKSDGTGTGLGLSICHGIISEHGGHIWVESEFGKGATFIVELPTNAKEVTFSVAEGTVTAANVTDGGKRILIMDDEPNILDVLSQSLQRRGYLVDTAENGAAGMVRLAQADYDYILCDVRMPEFSGFDFYRQMRARDPHTADKIVFITGDTVSTGTRKFIEENGVRYLAKPFELADVLAILRSPGIDARD